MKNVLTNDIIGFHGVTMLSGNPQATEALLQNDLGLEYIQETDDNVHYQTSGSVHHQIIGKVCKPTTCTLGWWHLPSYCMVSTK